MHPIHVEFIIHIGFGTTDSQYAFSNNASTLILQQVSLVTQLVQNKATVLQITQIYTHV